MKNPGYASVLVVSDESDEAEKVATNWIEGATSSEVTELVTNGDDYETYLESEAYPDKCYIVKEDSVIEVDHNKR